MIMNRLLKLLPLFSLLQSLLFGIPNSVGGAEFYIDPMEGDPNGDGSRERPWQTLENVIERGLIQTRDWTRLPHKPDTPLQIVHSHGPIRGGDTIWLREGYHGRISIIGAYNKTPITIAAMPGESPEVSSVLVRAVENWIFRGLAISPSHAPEYKKGPLVRIEDHQSRGPSRNITIEECDIYSVSDASAWQPEDWVEKASNGIQVEGDDVIIRNNRLRNVRFGISVTGKRCRVSSNLVDGFSGDGMRGLGDFGVYEYNVIKNAYAVDNNHDDGFQSWSVGDNGVGSGVVKGVVLRGNMVLNHEDPKHPFRSNLQGIGCFDGMYENWVIENNVIITDHWHGITLAGAQNTRIVNNTVIDLATGRPGPPWIRIAPHKDGRPSLRNVIRNNLVSTVHLPEDPTNTKDHNMPADLPGRFFLDVNNFNLHLKKGAPAIDKGSHKEAPEKDLDGVLRPQGNGIDIGAYEWTEE